MSPDSSGHVRAALRGADWEAILPRLLAYANRRIRRVGWYRGVREEASAMSAEELVHTAIDRCLDGSRTWNGDGPLDLERFLCGVIKSLCWNAKKGALRHPTNALEDSDEASRAPSAEEQLATAEDERAVLHAIEACTVDDADLTSFYLAVLDGNTKRDEIARVLGWTPERVSVARRKLNRRLTVAYAPLFDSTGSTTRAS